jgi:archaellum biogenesis protein FlaJ (TadC family)
MKKTLGAVVAGFAVQIVGLVLIHSVWLKQDYIITAPVWRALEAQQARVWAMLLGTLIYAAGAVLIYIRGMEPKPWIGQGVRFGILMALVTVVYSSLSGWVILPVPHMLVVKWIVGESALCVVFGMVVAGICQPKAARV